MADVGKLINWYIKLRDEKKEIEERHKQELQPYKEKMEKIEAALLKQMQEQGVKNFKSQGGTAYVTTTYSVSVADREELMNFVKENDRWDVLDIKANKSVASKENIPGTKVQPYQKVNIRIGG